MVQVKNPLVIPVFIPHFGCPHQCAFCNQSIITSQESKLPDKITIHNIVNQYLQYKGKREQVEIAFFGGNFLGLPHDNIIQLLDMIQPYIKEKKIDGIRFSTRPDTITRSILELVKPYNISAVELGVQSMNDEALLGSKRGHTSMDTINAMGLLKEYSFKIGVQVMVGLPGDTKVSLFESTKKVALLAPDFARIYPLMVLKGSLLEHWYCQGRYAPLSLEESIRLVKIMLGIFKAADIKVIRMGLQASDIMEDKTKLLAGPWHPAFGHLVYSEILYDFVCKGIDLYKEGGGSREIILSVNPKSESRLRGNKNINLKRLSQSYSEFDFLIRPDEMIPLDQIEINKD